MDEYYERCGCGGKYEGRTGGTFDCVPVIYPVKCVDCGKHSMSAAMDEALASGWPDKFKSVKETP